MNPLQHLFSPRPDPRSPDLIWMMGDLHDCLLCGHTLFELDESLTLVGLSTSPIPFELYQCEQCRCRYGWLEELMEVLLASGDAFHRLEAFAHRRTRFRAGVQMEGHGVMPWDEFAQMLQAARKQAEADEVPVPPEAVCALGVEQEAWELNHRVLQWVHTGDEDPVLAYVALVVDQQGLIRHYRVVTGAPPSPEVLGEVIYRAAVSPSPVTDHTARPLSVQVPPALNSPALRDRLAAVGIALEVAEVPQASKALAEITRTLSDSQGTPYLHTYDPALLRAFFKTAQAFFRLKPWQYFDGNKYIAFRLGDGPWGYLNVMGQAGEHPGLSYHPDWLSICRILYRPVDLLGGLFSSLLEEPEEDFTPSELEQVGSMESVGLTSIYELHPEDALFLQGLGVKPMRGSTYPLPMRLSEEGAEAPVLPLTTYMLLMGALTEAVQHRRGARITSIKKTLTGTHAPLTLRYPARGDEDWETGTGCCLRIFGQHLQDAEFNPLPVGHQVEVIAPGNTGFYEVARAIAQQANIWLLGAGQEQVQYWSTRGSRGMPNPRLYQLLSKANLWVSFGLGQYALSLTPLPDFSGESISVSLIQP